MWKVSASNTPIFPKGLPHDDASLTHKPCATLPFVDADRPRCLYLASYAGFRPAASCARPAVRAKRAAGGKSGGIMATEEGRTVDLLGDTRLNVASLLMEPVGNTRDVTIELDRLPLDEDLTGQNINAEARLTRIKDAILVDARVMGYVRLECATCLTDYDQPIAESFSEPFRQLVDVRSGAALPNSLETDVDTADDEPGFTIDESHELDLGEALRQWIVLAIPIKPGCGPDCPGPLLRSTDNEERADTRFASLASLLEDDDPGAGTT